jgi:hypothetical protein
MRKSTKITFYTLTAIGVVASGYAAAAIGAHLGGADIYPIKDIVAVCAVLSPLVLFGPAVQLLDG